MYVFIHYLPPRLGLPAVGLAKPYFVKYQSLPWFCLQGVLVFRCATSGQLASKQFLSMLFILCLQSHWIIWLKLALSVIKCSDCLCMCGVFLNNTVLPPLQRHSTWGMIKVQAAKIILVAEKHPFSRGSLRKWQWSNPTEPEGTAHPGWRLLPACSVCLYWLRNPSKGSCDYPIIAQWVSSYTSVRLSCHTFFIKWYTFI